MLDNNPTLKIKFKELKTRKLKKYLLKNKNKLQNSVEKFCLKMRWK